jgi:hypothetical protein
MDERKHVASREASELIEAFLVANPQPTSAQWKEFTLAHPQYAVDIADTALMLATAGDESASTTVFDTDLFNATRSAMLNAAHEHTQPFDAARAALKQCRGPVARAFAQQIGLGERVDLFNQMVSGEALAPYVLVKRLAGRLQVHIAAMAEVFAYNFRNQPAQAFKADGKPLNDRRPMTWEEAVEAAGVTGDEAARLLHLEKVMD